jgi:type VI secretion system protein ImpH
VANTVRSAPPGVARRAADPAWVSRRLGEAPWEFDLFQAMRLVEAAYPGRARIGEARRPVDEPVRFAQEPSLAFAPSAVAAFETGSAKAPRLVQRVFGLFGPNGALPIHLTDWARDRARNSGDAAFVRFLDVFHHRMLSLFYRAWAQAQAAVSMDRPRQDFFGRRLAALCGLGAPSLRDRDSVPDTVKLAHAGVFGRQVRSAECLQTVLADYFGVPVQIEEFVGHWLPIAPEQRSRLGGRGGFNRLGEDAVIGERTWHAQSRFRVVLGPLSFGDYERFLPRGRSSRPLHDLVKLYVGFEHSWEVKLVLKKDEVPLAWLGNSVWVGWSSWLGARLTDKDAADYSNTQGRPLPHWELQTRPQARLDEEAPQPEREPVPRAQMVQ